MTKGSMCQIGPTNGKHWLQDDEQLWRYVPLKNLFLYLGGHIFIPSVRKLQASEPFEGECFSDEAWLNTALHKVFGAEHQNMMDWIHGKLDKQTQEAIEDNKTAGHPEYAFQEYQKWYLDFIGKTRFPWCWFRASEESAAMWSTYGAHGAAVISNVGTIRSLFEKQEYNGGFRKMQYYKLVGNQALGFTEESPEGRELILRPFFLKRREYKCENEVRFVVVDTSSYRRGRDFLILEKVTPDDWIERIILGPGLTNQQISALATAVSGFSRGIRCDASKLHYGKKQEADDRIAELEKDIPKNFDDGISPFLKSI